MVPAHVNSKRTYGGGAIAAALQLLRSCPPAECNPQSHSPIIAGAALSPSFTNISIGYDIEVQRSKDGGELSKCPWAERFEDKQRRNGALSRHHI